MGLKNGSDPSLKPKFVSITLLNHSEYLFFHCVSMAETAPLAVLLDRALSRYNVFASPVLSVS
jgi:hypothetical protein